jgi:predicted enzyme related to lactoylglutathione lyase
MLKRWVVLLAMLLAMPASAAPRDVSVGSQYDSTHVYVAPADMDAFVKSFTATFGGQASAQIVSNVMPVPASTQFRYIWTPAGTLSTFAFLTPIPYPFGSERTGYLVADMDEAVKAVRASGGEVIVAPFKDPIGKDAVVQWPGGVRTQLYWHDTAPHYAPLTTVPDNRVYLSLDSADLFIADFLRFSHGAIVADSRHADGAEIGRPGEFFRRVQLLSGFGNVVVLVTDGHLPYPFGREVTGYETGDLDATIVKAKASGASILSNPVVADGRRSAMIQFPGGYIAEVHQPTTH